MKNNTMEIAKEKFIETFKKECDKALESINLDLFRFNGSEEEPGIEILSNDKVSFFIMKTSNNDAQNTFLYSGKILFNGFLDYKSIELTSDEFEDLLKYHSDSEAKTRISAKNKIISEGEAVLETIIA